MITMEKANFKDYLGKRVHIVVDRPMASRHPNYGFVYPINYGYIPNTVSGDGEELDAYIVGVFDALTEFNGECIALIHRFNDDDDKLVVAPIGKTYTKEQIEALVEFQERFFEYEIIQK